MALDVNALVSVALLLLAITGILFVFSITHLVGQACRTLIAYEKLADTLQTEVPATLYEFKHVAERVNQISSVTTKSVSDVGHKVEEVSGSLTQAAGQAGKQSKVWTTGLLAGIKAYLTSGNRGQEGGEAKKPAKQKGEEYVG